MPRPPTLLLCVALAHASPLLECESAPLVESEAAYLARARRIGRPEGLAREVAVPAAVATSCVDVIIRGHAFRQGARRPWVAATT